MEDSEIQKVQDEFLCSRDMAQMIIKSLKQIGEYEKFKKTASATEGENVRE